MKLPYIPGGQVLANHQRNLKYDGVVKLTQIQAGELLDLLQTIDQRVAVDEQLPGSFGNIQIVLEELVDGEQGLLIQRIDGVFLENFRQIDVAQGGGQLIDQPANAQILVVDDAALGVENLPAGDRPRCRYR